MSVGELLALRFGPDERLTVRVEGAFTLGVDLGGRSRAALACGVAGTCKPRNLYPPALPFAA